MTEDRFEVQKIANDSAEDSKVANPVSGKMKIVCVLKGWQP